MRRALKYKNFLVYALLAFLMLAGQAFTQDVQFTVALVKGKVTYRAYKSFKREDVKVGDKLDARGKVALADGDQLDVKTPMGDVISFQDKTYATLSKLTQQGDDKEVEISMPLGNIDCDVKKLGQKSSFQVRTPSAVAGVRGTKFGVSISPDGTATVSVTEGLVAVDPTAGGSSVSVGAGAKASVKAGSKGVKVQNNNKGGSKGGSKGNNKGGKKGGGGSGGDTSGSSDDDQSSTEATEPPEPPTEISGSVKEIQDIVNTARELNIEIDLPDAVEDIGTTVVEELEQIEFDIKR